MEIGEICRGWEKRSLDVGKYPVQPDALTLINPNNVTVVSLRQETDAHI